MTDYKPLFPADLPPGAYDEELATVSLADIIPQRPPFVMIDRLTVFGATESESVLTVRPDNIFCEDGCLSEYGMIENVAQTCAARIGFYCHVNHLPVRLGFIGAFSNMDIHGRPRAGETITTRVKVNCDVFNMLLVDAEVTGEDGTLLTTSMKIALSDIEAQ